MTFNPCAHLKGITQARLNRFTQEDINEVSDLYNLAWFAREAFNRFKKYDLLFTRAESDLTAATMHLTAQNPDYGQSLYSSYLVSEKFMKAMIFLITGERPPARHGLGKLLEGLRTDCKIRGLEDLEPLVERIPYNSSARYEASISRQISYEAYKSSLDLIGELGTISYSGVSWSDL